MDSFWKKGFSIGLALALGIAGNAYAATKGVINADDVNIRTQASTSSDVLKRLSTGVTVTVVDNTDDWYKLTTAAGGTAYVKRDFVTLTQADAVVEDEFINVRSNADITSSVLGVISKGQTITVTGVEGDWYTVTYNGQKGYVYNDNIQGDMLPYLNGVTAKVNKAEVDTTTGGGIYAVITSTSLNLR